MLSPLIPISEKEANSFFGWHTMTLEKSVCSHCGRAFETNGSTMVYSIKSFVNSCKIAVTTGVLLPKQLHYCSDQCMFQREQGLVDHSFLKGEIV